MPTMPDWPSDPAAILAMMQQMSGMQMPQTPQMPQMPNWRGWLASPPYDDETCGAMANLAETGRLLSDETGSNLYDEDGPWELADTVDNFSACAMVIPNIPLDRLAAMARAGAMAKAVELIRNRFGTDLARPDTGQQLGDALSRARSAQAGFDPSSWREAAAQQAMKWMPLSLLANRLRLPVSGNDALERIGSATRYLSTLQFSDPGISPEQMGQMIAYLHNADAVRRVFGVNPFAKGAGSAFQSIADRVRANAAAGMARAQGMASQASAAAALGRSGLDSIRKIDRTQAKALLVGHLRTAAMPILHRAMPVMATLQAAHQATGRIIARRNANRRSRRRR
jgi:hypothetical protein